MNSLFQIQIPKRSAHCSQAGEQLLPGMEIYSVLFEDESESLKRDDFCLSCWKDHQLKQQEENTPIRGYWKSKIEQRKAIKESSRVERALRLLRELQQTADSQEAEIFVLCLFLSHARQIALRQEFQKGETSYQLYEILRSEEFFTIKTIHLSHIQIERIQQSLARQLSTSDPAISDSLCNKR